MNIGAYENIKFKGLDIINNDTLKKEVVHFYEVEIPLLVNDKDRFDWVLLGSEVLHSYLENIDIRVGAPFDREALRKNKEFGNVLALLTTRRKRS